MTDATTAAAPATAAPSRLTARVARLLSPLVPIAAIFALVAAVIVALVAWPVAELYAGTGLAYLVLKRSERPWVKAAAGVLRPATWAFLLLSVLLTTFTLFVVPNTADPAQPIRAIELALLHVATVLPAWTKITGPRLAMLLAALVVVARYAPESKIVSRFLAVKKVVGVATAALAFATTFSFFTDDAVLGASADRAREHMTVVLRDAKHREEHAVATQLATQVFADALSRSTPESRARYATFARDFATLAPLDAPARDRVLDYVAWKEANDAASYSDRWTEPVAAEPTSGAASEPVVPNDGDPRDAVAASRRREALTTAETRAGVKAIVEAVLGVATGPAFDAFGGFVERVVERHVVAHALEKGMHKGVDRATKPLVEQITERFTQWIDRRAGVAGEGTVRADAAELVQGETARHVAALEQLPNDASSDAIQREVDELALYAERIAPNVDVERVLDPAASARLVEARTMIVRAREVADSRREVERREREVQERARERAVERARPHVR